MLTPLFIDAILYKYNKKKSEFTTLAVHQVSKNQANTNFNEKTLNKILRKHFTDGFNATDFEILSTISWRYFPRWSPKEMEEGRHWQVNRFPSQVISNRRYSPLRGGLTSSSCGGLRQSLFLSIGPKKGFSCCFCLFRAIFGVQ